MKGSSVPLVIAVLAFSLVGLHLVVDPRAYDVSQMVRLVALLAGLLVAVPVLLLMPRFARRIDSGVLCEPIVLASAAYLATCWASLGFALNVSAGFTDCFRTLGAFLVLCVVALVLPLDGRWKRWLLEAAIVATVIAVVAGFFKILPLLAEGLPTRRAMEEAFLDGLMSNVNLFAAWLLLLIPWCVCGAVVLAGRWRVIAAASAVAGTALIVILQSRAAWLGLAAAAGASSLLILRYRRSLAASDRLCHGVVGVLAAGFVTAAILAGLACTTTHLGEAIRARVIARPHQATGPSDGGRMMVWGIAGRMIHDHLVIGVGAGNFTLRLHEYFGPDAADDAPDFSRLSSDNWIQPHNDFLWVFAEKGVFGFVAFVAIFVTGVLAALAILRKTDRESGRGGNAAAAGSDAWLAVASLGALVAYGTVSCFDFPLDRISHQVVLAVHLAVLTALVREHRAAGMPRPLPGWLIVPPVLAAVALGLSYAWAAWGQEREVMVARRAQQQGDWLAMRDAARRAATPWKTLDPLAVPVPLFEGLAEVQLGNLPAATACFEQAYAANPNRLAVLQNLGAAYAQSGRLEEAVLAFATAAHRYPDRLDVRHNLASALIDSGQFAEAVAVLEDIPESLLTPPMREALAYARDQVTAAAVKP